ncbi:MAG: electron transfer flavoprotein subunit alpha/FixB family protein, partial [Pseudomonadota bacterium]
MAVLVVGEHDGAALKPAALSAVTAACGIGGGVAVLVAGSGCGNVAEAAARVAGIERVLMADDPLYAHPMAENLAKLVVSVAADFTHLLAGADSFGKNLMPRVAALLDVA